jgi:hypothetical protein
LSSYSDHVRATIQSRRRDVFRAWPDGLPAGGWSGTADDPSADLAGFLAGHPLRFGTSFPAGAGLSQWPRDVGDEIDAAGRRLRFTRSKSERLITIGPGG